MWCRDAEDLHGGAGLLLVTLALLARVLRQILKAFEGPRQKIVCTNNTGFNVFTIGELSKRHRSRASRAALGAHGVEE